MGRYPCCDENGIKKGPWTPEEDHKLVEYITKNGHVNWRALSKLAGLNRCGKSCRLRWKNYLRPGIKRGRFSNEEEHTILQLHSIIGNKWSTIASYLPGRTDNEIKNYWNTHLRKKLIQMGIDPITHQPRTDIFTCLNNLIALANLGTLIGQLPIQEQAMDMQRQALQFANLQNREAFNLSNLSPQNTPTQVFQDQGLINPIEDSNSQILLNNPNLIEPQVPFNYQTHLNNNQFNPNLISSNNSCFPIPAMSEGTTSLSNLGDGGTSCVTSLGDEAYIPVNWSNFSYDQEPFLQNNI